MTYRDARREQARLREQWGRRCASDSRARLPLVFARSGRRAVDLRRTGEALLELTTWALVGCGAAALVWVVMWAAVQVAAIVTEAGA